jgi:hypothetical protein
MLFQSFQPARRALAASVMVVVLAGSLPAAVAAPKECSEAFGDGQQLEQASKLIAAREKYLSCSAESCGKNLPKDCRERYEALLPRIPTLVLEAARGDAQLVEVQVSIDGREVAKRLDGRAIEVDPGEHVFVFTVNGESVSEKRLILESKKGQSVKASFPVTKVEAKSTPSTGPALSTTSAPESAPPPGAPQSVVDSGSSGSTQRWIGLAAGGVGLATLGIGGLVGLSARSTYKSADCDAANVCATPDDATLRHQAVSRAGTATLLVGVGAALVAGGVIVWLVAPSEPAKGSARAARGVTSVGLSPTGIVLGGSF